MAKDVPLEQVVTSPAEYAYQLGHPEDGLYGGGLIQLCQDDTTIFEEDFLSVHEAIVGFIVSLEDLHPGSVFIGLADDESSVLLHRDDGTVEILLKSLEITRQETAPPDSWAFYKSSLPLKRLKAMGETYRHARFSFSDWQTGLNRLRQLYSRFLSTAEEFLERQILLGVVDEVYKGDLQETLRQVQGWAGHLRGGR